MTLAVVATLWGVAGWAGVYKCTDPDTGAVTFSQVRCAADAEELSVGRPIAPVRLPPARTETPVAPVPPSPEKVFLDAWIRDRKAHGIEEMRSASADEVERCLSMIKAKSMYYDPGSVKVEDDPQFLRLGNDRFYISLLVNAKNRYGGYVGAKLKACYYSADGDLDQIL
ncbi:hypothetical protein EBL85_15505 [Marichromatium sp. AB32]|nr:hypothetical protein EBL85_15505 [Marichromatium sp. AB32]